MVLIFDGVSPRQPGMPDHTRPTVRVVQAVPAPGGSRRRPTGGTLLSLRERHRGQRSSGPHSARLKSLGDM